MGLSESLEKILQKNSGRIELDKVFTALGSKYARETIREFVKTVNNLIHFDGKNLTLLNYPHKRLLSAIDQFVKRTGFEHKYVFLLAASFIHFSRRSDKRTFEEFANFIKDYRYNYYLDPLHHSNPEHQELFWMLEQSIDGNWISQLDSESFYFFTYEFFEHIINSTFGIKGVYSTPSTLVDLITSIIQSKTPYNVYNPAGGILKLLTAINVKFQNIHAYASDISSEIVQLGLFFAEINDFHLKYNNRDSIDDIENLNTKYDLIISIPPFNVRNEINYYKERFYKDVALNIVSSSLKKLNKDGLAIFLVVDGVLFGQTKECNRFRQEIIESKKLQSIISLPGNLFVPVTSVKTSLLIFQKGINNERIRFINASTSKFFDFNKENKIDLNVSKIVELIWKKHNQDQNDILGESEEIYGEPDLIDVEFNQVKKEGFSLNLKDYFLRFFQLRFSEGYDYLESISPILPLPTNKEQKKYPFLRISDLTKGLINSIDHLSSNQTKSRGRILSEKAILIGTVGGSSKPSYYNLESIVELSSNIVALKPNLLKVLPEYLVQELNSDYVQKQIDSLAVGSTSLKYLRQEDLNKIKIKVPPPEEQIRILRERSEFIQQHSYKKTGDLETINDADIFRFINHEIGNILKGPDGFLSHLPTFIENQGLTLGTPFSSNTRSIGDRILSAKSDINKIYQIMANMKGILFSDKTKFKPSNTELVHYFQNKLSILKDHQKFDFFIGVDKDYMSKKKVLADLDGEQFEHIISNVISNGLNHGKFDDESEIQFVINIISIDQEVEIHFFNNGKPFPKNFSFNDFKSFSKKGGESTGQGLGGFLISKVVKNHSGTLSLGPSSSISIQTKEKSFEYNANVDIIISIPKKQ